MTEIKVAHSYKIYEPVSMIPARGWCAMYACEHARDNKNDSRRVRYTYIETLVAFVLTRIHRVDVYENGAETTATAEEARIMGYAADDIGGICPAEEADNFIGYLAPGARIPDHAEWRAKEYVLSHESESTEQESTDENP